MSAEYTIDAYFRCKSGKDKETGKSITDYTPAYIKVHNVLDRTENVTLDSLIEGSKLLINKELGAFIPDISLVYGPAFVSASTEDKDIYSTYEFTRFL